MPEFYQPKQRWQYYTLFTALAGIVGLSEVSPQGEVDSGSIPKFPVTVGQQGHVQSVLVTLGEEGHVQSEGFPSMCCVAQRITIKLDSNEGYIHLMFDDLDLPKYTQFKIYNSESESDENMFKQPPRYKQGVWQRPFITARIIHIVLIPRSSLYVYDTTLYTGFRASYTVKKDSTTGMTADLCPPLVVDGGEIQYKYKRRKRHQNMWLYCIWQIKSLPAGIVGLKTYIRFTELHINQGGKLQIRSGPSSESAELVAGQNIDDLGQPRDGFLTSSGFYIRAHMDAGDRSNKLTFVYGVVHNASKVSCVTSYRCSAPYDTWCIPEVNRCDSVMNCPNGDDEANCMRNTTTPITTAPSDVPVHVQTSRPKACPEYEPYRCPDGRCVITKWFCTGDEGCSILQKRCPDGSCGSIVNACPGQCGFTEKRCANGECLDFQYYCPEDECVVRTDHKCSNGRECYRSENYCNGYPHCEDGSDENTFFCFFDKKASLSLLVIPMLVIISIWISCKKRYRKQSVSRGGRTSRETAETNYMHRDSLDFHSTPPPSPNRSPHSYTLEPADIDALMPPLPPTVRAYNRHTSIQSPGPSPIPHSPPDYDDWDTGQADDSSVPPPSYDEVTIAANNAAPSPPSYDAVMEVSSQARCPWKSREDSFTESQPELFEESHL